MRRLKLLTELARLGSMREVADELGVTTSTVSQQIALLAREVGTDLLEPDGRRVRLTPAGRRLAEHAVGILAAVEAARLDLDPRAEPAGTVRVAGFATAVRRSLVPVVAELAAHHPAVRLRIHEHEPAEALDMLIRDQIDLALTYDYNLAPAPSHPALDRTHLWSAPWGLGVPTSEPDLPDMPAPDSQDSPSTFRRFADRPWIVNSRNTADEDVARIVASMADFEPVVEHRADSLDLVQDLIAGGLGVGLLPLDQPTRDGVHVLPLHDPDIQLCAFATVRRGRPTWSPLALILDLLGHDS